MCRCWALARAIMPGELCRARSFVSDLPFAPAGARPGRRWKTNNQSARRRGCTMELAQLVPLVVVVVFLGGDKMAPVLRWAECRTNCAAGTHLRFSGAQLSLHLPARGADLAEATGAAQTSAVGLMRRRDKRRRRAPTEETNVGRISRAPQPARPGASLFQLVRALAAGRQAARKEAASLRSNNNHVKSRGPLLPADASRFVWGLLLQKIKCRSRTVAAAAPVGRSSSSSSRRKCLLVTFQAPSTS